MTSKERVMTALDFRRPDRVPVLCEIWSEVRLAWEQANPDAGESCVDHFLEDIFIAVGNETPYMTQAESLGEEDGYLIERDGWGQVKRRLGDGYFYQQLSYAYDENANLVYGDFDSPLLEERYAGLDARMDQLKQRYCVFAKTGGPYIRTAFMRGEENFLMDMAGDPKLAAELAMRSAMHMAQVGVEEIRRWDLQDTGIWIYDDMAATKGPMFSPATAEVVLAPAWAHMIDAYRAAGATKIIMHSDGNIGPLIDLFLDLGIDGINPVEFHVGLDPVKLRAKYGDRLALLGGLDNAHILPRGDVAEVRAHVLDVLATGRDGGLVLGTHSVAPDISLETMELFRELVLEYGTYPMEWV
jgi:uroporphyrinogen decarboxylase